MGSTDRKKRKLWRVHSKKKERNWEDKERKKGFQSLKFKQVLSVICLISEAMG